MRLGQKGLCWGVLLFLSLGLTSVAHGATLYVGPQEAYTTIQAGIDAAVNGDTVVVRDGTYSGEGNQNITFRGKAITVRSEHGPSQCIVDGQGAFAGGFTLGGGGGALEGFTIKGFYNPDDYGDVAGCGISFWGSVSVTVSDCVITENFRGVVLVTAWTPQIITDSLITGNKYTGVACLYEGSISLTHCTISHNGTAGVDADMGSRAELTNCTVSNNGYYGVRFHKSGGKVTNCTISGNGLGIQSATSGVAVTDCRIVRNKGEGLMSYAGGVTLTNCLIAENGLHGVRYHNTDSTLFNCLVVGNGETGILTVGDNSPTVTNCTISGNPTGVNASASTRIRNTILWGNTAVELTGEPVVSYSCIRGGYAGEGNTSEDPRFFDTQVLHLRPTSPAIDAGDPDGSALPGTDLDGNPRVVGDRVDMGAFERCPTCLPTVALGVADRVAREQGQDRAVFRVYRVNGEAASALTVPYTLGGSAANGEDYLMRSGQAAIASGRLAGSVAILPLDDGLVEGQETVTLRLRDRPAYNVSDPHQATVRIVDDDTP